MPGVFITGTDTGVGKTLVAAYLLRALLEKGVDALPFKPVQTGCIPSGKGLMAPDLEFCLRIGCLNPLSNGTSLPPLDRLMCPFRFRPACSPHLAAELDGRRISIDDVLRSLEKLERRCDFIVAEGAGGIMVPLNRNETMLDLMKSLGWPVLLIARGGLGTLNHTLLSLDALERSGCLTIGTVINHSRFSPCYISQDNPVTIRDMSSVQVIGEIPFLTDASDAEGNDPVNDLAREMAAMLMEA